MHKRPPAYLGGQERLGGGDSQGELRRMSEMKSLEFSKYLLLRTCASGCWRCSDEPDAALPSGGSPASWEDGGRHRLGQKSSRSHVLGTVLSTLQILPLTPGKTPTKQLRRPEYGDIKHDGYWAGCAV